MHFDKVANLVYAESLDLDAKRIIKTPKRQVDLTKDRLKRLKKMLR